VEEVSPISLLGDVISYALNQGTYCCKKTVEQAFCLLLWGR